MCIVVKFITTLGILLSGLGHNDSTTILYIYSRAGGINIHGRYIQLLQSWCYSYKANNIIWTPTIQKSIQAILKSTTRTWTWSVDCPLKLYNECPWEEHDNEAGNFNGKSYAWANTKKEEQRNALSQIVQILPTWRARKCLDGSVVWLRWSYSWGSAVVSWPSLIEQGLIFFLQYEGKPIRIHF